MTTVDKILTKLPCFKNCEVNDQENAQMIDEICEGMSDDVRKLVIVQINECTTAYCNLITLIKAGKRGVSADTLGHIGNLSEIIHLH